MRGGENEKLMRTTALWPSVINNEALNDSKVVCGYTTREGGYSNQSTAVADVQDLQRGRWTGRIRGEGSAKWVGSQEGCEGNQH